MTDRRDTWRVLPAAVFVCGLALGGVSGAHGEDATPAPKRSVAIKYVNPQVPEVTLPEYRGTRYLDEVPDTLDIAERAKLTIRRVRAQREDHRRTSATDRLAGLERV